MRCNIMYKTTITAINMDEVPMSVGYEAYLVGGCVRDMLLEDKVIDWDITTNASSEEIVKVCQDILKTSVYNTSWKTVKVCDNNEPNISIEITSYKYGHSLQQDLLHRDFTMNAIAVDITGNLYDPYNGIKDIENRCLRFTNNDVHARIQEDPLRLLRMIRFLKKYNFQACFSVNAVNNMDHLLSKIPYERIYSELCKILLLKRNNKMDISMNMYYFKDIIFAAIPELKASLGYYRNENFLYDHDDLYLSIMKSIDMSTDNDIIIKLALLFHDITKPYECSFDHSLSSAYVTDEILARFKCSNKIRKAVFELIENHEKVVEPDVKSIRKLIHKLGIKQVKRLIMIQYIISHFDISDNLVNLGGEIHKAKFIFNNLESAYHNHIGVFNVKDLCINGTDLIEMGYSESPIIGVILNHLLEAILDERIENTYEDCRQYIHELENRWKYGIEDLNVVIDASMY